MIGLFTTLLERLVAVGVGLMQALVVGILGAPAAALATAGTRVRRAAPPEVVDLRHRVLRDGRPRDTAIFAGDDLPDTRHWVAERQGRVVGVVTVLVSPFPDGEGPGLQLRGMAVDPALQGTGVGQRLLAAVCEDVGQPMWCNARERAVPFYERAGWRVVSEPFDIAGVGPHRRMVSPQLPVPG